MRRALALGLAAALAVVLLVPVAVEAGRQGFGTSSFGGWVNVANPVDNEVLTFSGGTWKNAAAGSSGLANVVEDLTPQLGADLDTQTFDLAISAFD